MPVPIGIRPVLSVNLMRNHFGMATRTTAPLYGTTEPPNHHLSPQIAIIKTCHSLRSVARCLITFMGIYKFLRRREDCCADTNPHTKEIALEK